MGETVRSPELDQLGDDLATLPFEDSPEDDMFDYGEDPMAHDDMGMHEPEELMGPEMGHPLRHDPHGPRDETLEEDAPHQFWAQESPHVQDALNKYLIPQLDNPNPEISNRAHRILMEGPHSD
jgi:hypothetical protein